MMRLLYCNYRCYRMDDFACALNEHFLSLREQRLNSFSLDLMSLHHTTVSSESHVCSETSCIVCFLWTENTGLANARIRQASVNA